MICCFFIPKFGQIENLMNYRYPDLIHAPREDFSNHCDLGPRYEAFLALGDVIKLLGGHHQTSA